jgi:hypothetical protein
MSGIVGSKLNIRGSGLIGSLGTDGQHLLSSGAGVTNIFETAAAGGITEADQWRTTADTSGGSTDITANWERSDEEGYSVLGTGMTESSGVFTFPSTGYWKISVHLNVHLGSDSYYIRADLMTTINNSDYNYAGEAYTYINHVSSNTTAGLSGELIFDVTNTTNCKFKISTGMAGSAVIKGSTTINQSYVVFEKLADT